MGQPDNDGVGVAAAADVELGPLSLKALFKLQASLDDHTETLKKISDQENRYRQGVITRQVTGGGSTASVVVDLVIGLEGPSTQRQWELRALSVAYADPTTAGQTGKAYAFYAPSRPTLPLAAGIGWFDVYAALPSAEFYGSGEAVIRHPNRLWVVIVGGAASTQYVVNGSVQESADQYHRQIEIL